MPRPTRYKTDAIRYTRPVDIPARSLRNEIILRRARAALHG